MTVILPPGSTSTELQAAIDNAASGDTIVISSDMPLDTAGPNTISIEQGKEITIQSNEGNKWTMLQESDYTPHFTVNGILNLSNVILDVSSGAIMAMGGIDVSGAGSRIILNDGVTIQNCRQSGIHGYDGGEIIMNDGVVVQDCISGRGGGVNLVTNCRFVMNGGSILNCQSRGNEPGGGVFITGYCAFIMNGGLINGCSADSGGGVTVSEYSTFTMTGGTVSGNTVMRYGGGIYLMPGYTTFTMTGGKITENISTYGNGGGLALNWGCTANITGKSYITKNVATSGSGGGIYIDDNTDYSRLTTSAETIFSCNIAQAIYRPSEDPSVAYPNIQFASTSVTDHAINNYDISNNNGEPVEETFHLTYNANGGTGKYIGAEIPPGNTELILHADDAGISRQGLEFTVWNTEPDGSGTAYAPGDRITLDCSTVLFAQWTHVYKVTYDSNGGIGGYVDYCREFEVFYSILSTSQTSISRSGFTFMTWNTEPNGLGTSYFFGEIITVNSDVTLYAQWRTMPGATKRCRATATKSRKAVEGRKIWVDNNNVGNTRPSSVEIILLRDGEVYRRTNVVSEGDGYFGFCCLPVYGGMNRKFNYQVDEVVPNGYTKTIEGYTIINTLTP